MLYAPALHTPPAHEPPQSPVAHAHCDLLPVLISLRACATHVRYVHKSSRAASGRAGACVINALPKSATIAYYGARGRVRSKRITKTSSNNRISRGAGRGARVRWGVGGLPVRESPMMRMRSDIAETLTCTRRG